MLPLKRPTSTLFIISAIINISSGTALMYLPNMGAYSASKRALANISLTAREELKKDNIIISVLYPYITLTDFEENTIKSLQMMTGNKQAMPHFHLTLLSMWPIRYWKA